MGGENPLIILADADMDYAVKSADSSVHDEAYAPLGGMKNSGWGKNGMEALEEFTEIRWVTLQRTRQHFPF